MPLFVRNLWHFSINLPKSLFFKLLFRKTLLLARNQLFSFADYESD